MSKPTHQVVDFGPGPQDHTLGYPFEGTEEQCSAFAAEANANYPNVRPTSEERERFCLQEIPEDDERD